MELLWLTNFNNTQKVKGRSQAALVVKNYTSVVYLVPISFKKDPQPRGEDNDKLHAMQSWSSPFPWGDPINCRPDKSLSRKHCWLPAACLSVCMCLSSLDLAMTHPDFPKNFWLNSLSQHFLIKQTWQEEESEEVDVSLKKWKIPAITRKQRIMVGWLHSQILSSGWKGDNPRLLRCY